MQLTTEIVISWLGGALSGAMVAWLGNRVMNAELWGHIKKHCGELETACDRLDAHSREIRDVRDIAIDLRGQWRRFRIKGDGD